LTWIDGVILGLVQGVTEFIPVSSDGHLVLVEALLGAKFEGGVLVEVLLHLGTLVATIAVFRREVAELLRALPALFRPKRWRESWHASAAFRTVIYIAVSAVPAGVAGLLLEDRVGELFGAPAIAAAFLMVNGVLLLTTRLARRGDRPIDLKIAAAMGCVQAVAILPGISRSGTTISTGLFAGGERESVGRFSFLMGLVPIAGAIALQLRKLDTIRGGDIGPIVLGMAVALVSGVIALRVLMRVVKHGRIHLFGPYCILAGAAAFAWLKLRA
jgi:undecaprenyl-diphosphatase